MTSKKRGSILRSLGMALPFIAATGFALADGPTISGYVDTQYGYNFDKPVTGVTTLRSYDLKDNNISNTAHLAIGGSFGEGIGYNVELDAGHDAATTGVVSAGNTSGSDIVLQEAYLTYLCPISKIGIKAGKFVTYEGIEVIESPANPTISRGFLFGLAEPYTHVGGVLTYAMGKVDFAAGVVNGWDVPNDNNSGKTFVGKMGLNLGDMLSATLSGYHGPEQTEVSTGTTIVGANRDSIDLTMLTKIIPKVDLYLQGNVGTEKHAVDLDGDSVLDDRANWSGAAIEPLIHFTDKVTLGGRLEYFADPQGARTLTGNTDVYCTNFTITPGYKFTDNIQVRAEYRYDSANKKIWIDDSSTAKDSASTGSLQFLVTF